MPSTWAGSFRLSDSVIVPAGSPYTALLGEVVVVDTTLGTVTVKAPASPEDSSYFGIVLVNQAGSDITIDGNGELLQDSSGDYGAGPTITGFEANISLRFFYDGNNWLASISSSAVDRPVKLSTSVHVAGTVEVQSFRCQRYDPSAGSMTIEAPSSPFVREKFGICNETSSVESITIDGNGNNLQDPSFNSVASFVSTAPNAWAIWEYDGAEWMLMSQGGGLLSGVGNQAHISRPFNGTADVNYLAGFQKVEQFTAENSGTGLDADFATNAITINKQGLFNIEGQCTIAGKNGSRTDLTIAIDGVQTEDRWVSQSSGLNEPSTFQPKIDELAVSSPPVVVTVMVQNSANGNKTIRHYALKLSIMEL